MRAEELAPTELERAPQMGLDYDSWVHALFPERGQGGLEDIFVSLSELSRTKSRQPLRLPIVSDMPALPQLQAWWVTLTELGLLEARKAATTFCPFCGEEGVQAGWVLFLPRPLQAGDARWLHLEAQAPPLGPGDLCAGRPAARCGSKAVPEASARLADSLRAAYLGFRARRGG